MDLFGSFSQYYVIVIVLQGICAFHSIRKGTQSKWIWIIVFLPLVGSLAYIFTEIIQKQHVSSVQEGVAAIVNPSGRVRKLERALKFSDTMANRTALADAYLASGMYAQAATLYESCLTNLFSNSEQVIKNLIQAYFHLGRYEDVIHVAPKVAGDLTFPKSPANLMYAIALEKCNLPQQAEREYAKLNLRFSNYEARYRYGLFLLSAGRKEEAVKILQGVADEAQHMTRAEKGSSSSWIQKTEQTLKTLESKTVAEDEIH